MKYYPVFLNLKDHMALVIGAGPVGIQKIQGLLDTGARVRVVATEAQPELETWIREKRVEWHQRPYETTDLDGAAIVFAATDDTALQQRIAKEARERQIWVNIVDVTPLCDFIAPSIVSRGDLQIAISTGGAAPALAKYLRQKLEPLLGVEYGELVRIAEAVRPEILKLPKERRRALWDRIVSDGFIDQLRREGPAKAEQLVKEWIHGNHPV